MRDASALPLSTYLCHFPHLDAASVEASRSKGAWWNIGTLLWPRRLNVGNELIDVRCKINAAVLNKFLECLCWAQLQLHGLTDRCLDDSSSNQRGVVQILRTVLESNERALNRWTKDLPRASAQMRGMAEITSGRRTLIRF